MPPTLLQEQKRHLPGCRSSECTSCCKSSGGDPYFSSSKCITCCRSSEWLNAPPVAGAVKAPLVAGAGNAPPFAGTGNAPPIARAVEATPVAVAVNAPPVASPLLFANICIRCIALIQFYLRVGRIKEIISASFREYSFLLFMKQHNIYIYFLIAFFTVIMNPYKLIVKYLLATMS